MNQDDVLDIDNANFLLFDDTVNGTTMRYLKPRLDRLSLDEKNGEDIFEQVIIRATSLGAQNIHIEPKADGATVRYRMAGVLHEDKKLSISESMSLIEALKTAAGMRVDVVNLPQDGTLSIRKDDKPLQFDVSSLPTSFGENIVLTIRRGLADIPSLQQLGVWGQARADLLDEASRLQGLVLIVGSDKKNLQACAYSLLSLLNHKTINVAAIESLPSFTLPGVSQIKVANLTNHEVEDKINLAIRQDVDALLVEEIRTATALDSVIQAALAKKTVISSLHAASAYNGIKRLLDSGIQPYLLASSLRCVVELDSISMLCPHCRQKHEPTSYEKTELHKKLKLSSKKDLLGLHEQEIDAKSEGVGDLPLSTDESGIKTLFKRNKKGCKKCFGRGVRGRINAASVVTIDESLAKSIMDNSTTSLKKFKKDNSVTKLILALRGQIDYSQL